MKSFLTCRSSADGRTADAWNNDIEDVTAYGSALELVPDFDLYRVHAIENTLRHGLNAA